MRKALQMISRSSKNFPARNRGFNLIELMVTIGILAILVTVAIPSFSRLIASNRLSAATNELYGTLMQAKSEAIRQGNRITVCPSSNGTGCATVGTPIPWSDGWISFSDTTRSAATPSIDAGESILQISQAVPTNIVILGNTNFASFRSDGSAVDMFGALLLGTIRVCSTSSSLDNNSRARDIVISRPSRLKITTPTGVANTCPAPA
jgi:type IV fimbrial biogenesis protein FimT